jgi:hypothetical protein
MLVAPKINQADQVQDQVAPKNSGQTALKHPVIERYVQVVPEPENGRCG